MKISNSVNRITPSLARELFNMAKQYDDVIDLTLGDPDFPPPENIKRAACKAIEEGKTHYSANAGLKEARDAVGKHIQDNWGIKADTDQEVIVTVGGMEALFLSLSCIVNPGDEVIIFAPYYINYVQMINFLGGKPVILDVYKNGKGIEVNREILHSCITSKTVAIIVNSPNNPTGDVFDVKSLSIIAEESEENDLVVISDEVYRTLLFDGINHESILQFPYIRKNVVLIDSLSKEFCMTGWRIGYAYGDSKLIENMVKLQENVAACATLPSQYALIEAYNNPQEDSFVLMQFQTRRDYLYEKICKINKLSCVKPKGTFYLFVNIEETGLNSIDFAYQLLEKEHIAIVPGVTYGENYTGYIRIAFTKDISVLEEAIERLKHFMGTT